MDMLPKYDSKLLVIITVAMIVLLTFMNTSLISTTYISKAFQDHPSAFLRDRINVALKIDNGISNSNRVFDTINNSGTLTIVTISNNGIFLPGATFSISPNPTTRLGNFTIKDNEPPDINNVTTGVITISGLKQGKYIVTQTGAPRGYSIDKLSKIVVLTRRENTATATATFTDTFLDRLKQQNNINNNLQINGITYNAKFECGSISGDEGPLRPGHYDTDIGMFNRQDFPVKILWNAVVNDGKSTSPIVITLQPQTSRGIMCKDIRQLLNNGNNSNKLLEGFVLIRISLNDRILGSLLSLNGDTTALRSVESGSTQINFLDVQVFYTANALETLPHEILVSKIRFLILNDSSSKIAKSLLMKPLDITLQSQLNQIFDPESQVKSSISQKYNLSASEVAGLRVKITNVNIGVGSMIDDHAISSYVVTPQISSS